MKKTRRILAALAAAALSAACLAGTAFADGGAVVSVSDAAAEPGGEATVGVSIEGNPGFGSYGMKLSYDASRLELTSIEPGALSAGFFSGNAGTGKVGFASGSLVEGDGVLFTATFKVLEPAAAGDVDVAVSVVVDELDADGGCAVSGGKVTAEHRHSYAEAWSFDGSGHWRACACGAKDGEAAHDERLVVDVEPGYGAAGSGHYECACGWKGGEPVEIPALHRCEFSDGWSCDGSGHWHACAVDGCPERDGFAGHDFGGWAVDEGDASAEVRVCSVCGWAERRDAVSAAEGAGGSAAVSASGEGGLSQTGDSLGAAAAALALAALASGGALVALRRRSAA